MFYKKTNKDSNKDKELESSKSSNSFKNPEILGVNLVKDELVVFFDWNKYIFSAILVFLVAGLFIFEIYLGLDYWEKKEAQKANLIELESNKVKKDIVVLNSKSKDALSYKDKSAAFSDLLSNHVYWTRFFSWLELNTLNTVKYEGFEGDVSGLYTLSASAPTYAEASWQTKIFSDSLMVKNVSINNASVDSEESSSSESEITEEDARVYFEIELDLKTDIFKK